MKALLMRMESSIKGLEATSGVVRGGGATNIMIEKFSSVEGVQTFAPTDKEVEDLVSLRRLILHTQHDMLCLH